ncbi:cupin domain-containing protein [Achromobacter sp. NFACC18-2]|uniref:cupin domain-containing protein n=1 Tax=Achromobacter sp. NFACC18-2 TaxID=1564112 RepID=UPI0008C3E31E|nr:cupin domain-containing protein [Achromobacter sp. NFACC18-2]SEJ78566.1 transcriptional regulator, XRE family with cupin sensor [Achromobacter sp. NFACC18-2]
MAKKSRETAAEPHDAHEGEAALSTLGPRLRHARMVHGLTLKALAQAAECSESLLSRVERGQAMPSLANLHRLARALGTNVAELTAAHAPPASPVIRQADRPIIEFTSQRGRKPGVKLERVIVPMRGQLLQADIHQLAPKAESLEQIAHAGEEMGYVIEGEFELRLGSEVHLMQAGDSFYFSSDVPHSYRNPGRTVARVLWVNTPATF